MQQWIAMDSHLNLVAKIRISGGARQLESSSISKVIRNYTIVQVQLISLHNIARAEIFSMDIRKALDLTVFVVSGYFHRNPD